MQVVVLLQVLGNIQGKTSQSVDAQLDLSGLQIHELFPSDLHT